MKKVKGSRSGPPSFAKAIARVEVGMRPTRSIELLEDGSLQLDYALPKVFMTLSGVERDAVPMVESYFLSEDDRAWLRIVDVMDLALMNPDITNNPHAAEFCERVRGLALHARGDFTIEQVLSPLRAAAKSIHASDVASKKNAQPRAWVLEQWHRREDPLQSKASFARQLAPLVKKKFDLNVTPETIGRDWLPKGGK